MSKKIIIIIVVIVVFLGVVGLLSEQQDNVARDANDKQLNFQKSSISRSESPQPYIKEKEYPLENQSYLNVCCSTFSDLDTKEMRGILAVLTTSPFSVTDEHRASFWRLVKKYNLDAEIVDYLKKLAQRANLLGKYFWEDATISFQKRQIIISQKRQDLLNELVQLQVVDEEVNERLIEPLLKQIADHTAVVGGVQIDEVYINSMLESYGDVSNIVNSFFLSPT